jgi:hypothetical protein
MIWNNKRLQLLQNNFSTWVNSLTHLFQEFLKETTYPFRLVEIKYCEEREGFFTNLQLTSKNLYFETSLQELVVNNELIENLSPADVRLITYFACMESMEPQFYVDSWHFSKERKEEVFTIKNRLLNYSLTKTAPEIYQEKSMLKKFNPEDAHTIGFIQGSNSVLRETKELKQIKCPAINIQ